MQQSATIRFGVLGPIEAWNGGTQVSLGPPKRRVLLARLLLDSPRPVSVERLRQDLWAEHQPAGAVSTIHAHISRLRAALEPERTAGARSTLLVRESGGYALRAARETLDSAVFEDLVARARRLRNEGQTEDALRTAEDALRLWRGPALHDAAEHSFAASEAGRLQSLRQTAQEMRVAVLLELGQADAAVTPAEALTVTAPLREESWALLMKALYATGRSAEALQHYERFRVDLAEELGVDPGSSLRQLHLAILHEDTAAILPQGKIPAPHTAPAARPPAPEPMVSFPLVGREAELERLTLALAQAEASGVRWGVVSGARGLGKTRLLQEAAQRANRRGFRVARLGCCGSSDSHDSTAVFGPAARLLNQLTKDGEPFSPASQWTEEDSLTALVQKLAEQPALLLMDDIATFCSACLRLLQHLSVLLRGESTVVLCATGERDDRRIAPLLASLPRGYVLHIGLQPLTADNVQELLHGVGDIAPGELLAHAQALRERTDGNPFILTELLQLPPQERVGTQVTIPPAIVHTTLTRLDGLPEPARRMTIQAAAYGEVLDMDLLAALMDIPHPQVFELVDMAVEAELVVWHGPAPSPAAQDEHLAAGCYRFHSVMRHAVLATLSPVTRQLLHASIASVLRTRPGHTPVAIAEQLIQAGPMTSYKELARDWCKELPQDPRRAALYP